MTRSSFSLFHRMVVLPLAAVALSTSMAHADFRGGGSLFGFTDACAGWATQASRAVRVRYSASEDQSSPPSQVTLAFGTGTEHFALWGAMAPSGNQFFGAAGRQTWTRFVFYDNRPRIRIVQRSITERINASGPETIPNARAVTMRLRIQNFSNIDGCAATLVANLRRN